MKRKEKSILEQIAQFLACILTLFIPVFSIMAYDSWHELNLNARKTIFIIVGVVALLDVIDIALLIISSKEKSV